MYMYTVPGRVIEMTLAKTEAMAVNSKNPSTYIIIINNIKVSLIYMYIRISIL